MQMDDLFYSLLEEVMHGVEHSYTVFADYLLDHNESYLADMVRIRNIPYKLQEIYFDRIYPDTIEMTDEQIVKLFRETKDPDKKKRIRKKATPFQKKIIEAITLVESSVYGVTYRLERVLINNRLLLKRDELKQDHLITFRNKAKILKLLGYAEEAERIAYYLKLIDQS